MATGSTVLVVFLTISTLAGTECSSIVFHSSSTSLRPLQTNNLTLTCSVLDVAPAGSVGRRRRDTSLDQTDNLDINDLDNSAHAQTNPRQSTDDVAYITSIVIIRDGQDIATVISNFPATPVGGASGFGVTGSLGGANGHLELAWTRATPEDSGDYVCEINTLNSNGRHVVFSRTLSITHESTSLSDIVSALQKLQHDKDKMQETINTMNSTIAQQGKAEPNVFFTVGLTASTNISNNQIVKYDHVITNQGAGYDVITGQFTSQVAGFFHFEFHGYITEIGGGLVLRHNLSHVVSALAYGPGGYRQASNSATLQLAVGDTVDVAGWLQISSLVGDILDNETNTFNAQIRHIINTFSGRLLADV